MDTYHDQGYKLKSLISSLRHGKKMFASSSGVDSHDARPVSSALESNVNVGDGGMTQSDEPIRQVMYLNCWGPS
ncbi:serine/threonine-protein kinase [Tanacetum coccineum]